MTVSQYQKPSYHLNHKDPSGNRHRSSHCRCHSTRTYCNIGLRHTHSSEPLQLRKGPQQEGLLVAWLPFLGDVLWKKEGGTWEVKMKNILVWGGIYRAGRRVPVQDISGVFKFNWNMQLTEWMSVEKFHTCTLAIYGIGFEFISMYNFINISHVH